MSLSRKDKTEFLGMLERIPDNQLRYFYLMLGSALADQPVRANTGPQHIAELQERLSR